MGVTFQASGVSYQSTEFRIQQEFPGSRPDASLRPIGQQGTVSELIGADRKRWGRGSFGFSSLEYRQLYSGIDLIYSQSAGLLKSEYRLQPGTNASPIRIRYRGAEHVRIRPDGSLEVSTPHASLLEARPVIYQVRGDAHLPIEGGYRLLGNATVGFYVRGVDPALPLVIDPTVTFSTYFGGTGFSAITSVATDAQGSVYVAGWTESLNVLANPTLNRGAGSVDVFVAKLSADGRTPVYLTYLGGRGTDMPASLTVDSAGNAIVAGSTNSNDFPTMLGIQNYLRGSTNAFVAKLKPDGSDVVFSTYLGGEGSDSAFGVAVDATGIFVAGSTSSQAFPVLGGLQNTLSGPSDAFITKLSGSGTILYSTYLGGGGREQALSVAARNGEAYLAGWTDSSNFPTVRPFQSRNRGGSDAFIAKLNASGNALVYSTYLGGSGGSDVLPEQGNGIAVNGAGEAWVVGETSSPDFPVQGAGQAGFAGGGSDAFYCKLSSDGQSLVSSAYLGGAGRDRATALALDSSGNAILAGVTDSVDFPVAGNLPSNAKGGYDAFFATVTKAGILTSSTYWGGSAADAAAGVAVSSNGTAYLGGRSLSTDFATQNGLQMTNRGGSSGFVSGFSLGNVSNAMSKVGIFRSGYFWMLDVDGNRQFNSPPDFAFPYGGVPGDLPITGDWNGDGRSKVGIYRPANGLFILDSNGNGVFDAGDAVFNLGAGTVPGDIPVAGDWNGDGRTKVGLFRLGFFWILDYNGNGAFDAGDKTFAFGGVGGDIPLVGDWNGSGTSKIGLFRQGFYWILDYNGNGTIDNVNQPGGDKAFPFAGIAGDLPLVGDWNGDGRAKVGIFRFGFFWILDANGNYAFDGTGPGQDFAFGFGGAPGDKPVVGRW